MLLFVRLLFDPFSLLSTAPKWTAVYTDLKLGTRKESLTALGPGERPAGPQIVAQTTCDIQLIQGREKRN